MQVSRYEYEGWISELKTRLEADEKNLEASRAATRDYASERWGLLTDVDRDVALAHSGWTSRLRDR